MKSDRKQTILFIIILLVMSMGIGYAFLTTTLSIDGTSDIDASSWDVHFENVQVLSGSITGTQVITPATISADGQTVSYHIKLNQPGDYYKFSIEAVNAGSLDAAINSGGLKLNGASVVNLPSYLVSTMSYDIFGGNQFVLGDILWANTRRKMYIMVGYNDILSESDLPSENLSLSIEATITFSQAEKGQYVYTTTSATELRRGRDIGNFPVYETYQEAIDNFSRNIFVRLYLVDNKVYEESVGILLNGNVYYLYGGDSGYRYLYNKNYLDSLFSNCSEYSDHYYCVLNSHTGASIYENGRVVIVDGGYGCALRSIDGFECGDFSI